MLTIFLIIIIVIVTAIVTYYYIKENTKKYKSNTIKHIITELENLGINKRYIGAISLFEKYKWFSTNAGIVNEIEIEIYNLQFANKLKQEYKHSFGKVNIIYRGEISDSKIKIPGGSTWCKWDKKEKTDYIEWMNSINENHNFNKI